MITNDLITSDLQFESCLNSAINQSLKLNRSQEKHQRAPQAPNAINPNP